MAKNQYKKVKKMYELLGEFLAKHHFTNTPTTMMEIATMRLPGSKERELARQIKVKDTCMRSALAESLITKNKA